MFFLSTIKRNSFFFNKFIKKKFEKLFLSHLILEKLIYNIIKKKHLYNKYKFTTKLLYKYLILILKIKYYN